MNPNEARQNAYLQLVQALLECPSHLEEQLLELNSEFVDLGLVMTLLAVAQKMMEQDDPAAVSTIEWLVDFAQKLAQKLGMDMGESPAEDDEDYAAFVLNLLQTVNDSEGDEATVYAFLSEHLSYLNEHLLAIFPQHIDRLFALKTEPEWKLFIASDIHNSAVDLGEFTSGNRSINLELAIACYDRALSVYTQSDFPEEWAMMQNNLANTYRDRIEGDRTANLELAIQAYQAALEVRTPRKYPIESGRIQASLEATIELRDTLAQRDLHHPDIYESEILTPSPNPEYADFFLDLLQAVVDSQGDGRIVYQFFDNHLSYLDEELLANLPQHVRILLARKDESNWKSFVASTLNSLAIDLYQFPRGNRAINLELAIECYRLALEVYTRAAYPEQWARTQMNLAVAYRSRIRGERAANLELSIESYQLALEVYTRAAYPEQWAMTQMGLAGAYWSRIRGERAINLELSIECYRLALEVYTRADYPEDWAMTQNNLAVAYGDRIRGERAANLELAIECYRLALEIYTREAYPEDCLKAARNLGNLHYEIDNWQPAIHAYETAMQAVETSRSWALNDESRQELSKNALSIYENAIQCAINLQNYSQAIQFTERIRSRSLVELMESKDLYADAQLPPEIATYLTEYEDLNHQIQSIRQQPDSFGDKAAAITTLERQKAATYDKLRKLDPVLAGEIQVTAIDFASIQELITTPHTAILTCYTTDDDTHIFIIKQSGAPTIHTCKNQGWAEFQRWLQTEWINLYHTDLPNWQQNLPHRLEEISQRLQLDTLIATHLTDINELIIVPHLNLHQIPFAALPITPLGNFEGKGGEMGEGGRMGRKELESQHSDLSPHSPHPKILSDRFLIRSIPSCQILQYCKNRPEVKTAIVGTVEDAEDNLPGARYEGAQIAALYNIPPTNRLIGSQATPANYRELLTRVNRLHSSHHATSRPDNPLESALILAQGETITLSDLLTGTRYPHLDEVFLSACETHVGTTTITDDIATLTTGFLCIGARSVQSTLWAVNDIVTVIFSLFYHQQRHQGKNPTISLHIAQQQLRNLTGEQFAKYQPIIDAHRLPAIASLDDRIATLIKQQSTLDLDTQKGAWDELQANIEKLKSQVQKLDDIYWNSEDYCELERPFEHPFYWAGFITQGMA